MTIAETGARLKPPVSVSALPKPSQKRKKAFTPPFQALSRRRRTFQRHDQDLPTGPPHLHGWHWISMGASPAWAACRKNPEEEHRKKE
ncbi:MAG: hypothetical protein J7K88_13540 [Candidatus Fermentibacteraceae bacterium]|nr:hypothetical protein [Candidatus Fermentibacteraceae bacterium]